MTFLSFLGRTAFTPAALLSFLTIAHCGSPNDRYPDVTTFCGGRAKAELRAPALAAIGAAT